MSTELDRRKASLRDRMRAARAAITSEQRSVLEARIEARLLALPEIEEAGTVLLFYAFGTEVGTRVLARRLHDREKRLFLPYLHEPGMEAAEILPGDPLEETGYGPREPGRPVPVRPEEVDAVVTPGLAFDRRGRRLGYGGGHYDRYLARLESGTARIGIGFSVQLVEDVPAGPDDALLDLVVTDAEVVRCRDPRGEERGRPL